MPPRAHGALRRLRCTKATVWCSRCCVCRVSRVASRVVTSDYVVDLPGELSPDSWIRVSGGGMPHAVDVRIGLSSGRPVVLALRIDDGSEVSARDLRAVRLPGIAESVLEAVRGLAEDLEPSDEAAATLRGYEGPLSHDWSDVSSSMLTVAEEGASALNLRSWLSRVEQADVESFNRSRKRGIGAPSDEQYEAFAKAYLEEHLRRPHGAKTRLAARLMIDRVTVYRWAKTARERGLLPPEGGKGTGE